MDDFRVGSLGRFGAIPEKPRDADEGRKRRKRPDGEEAPVEDVFTVSEHGEAEPAGEYGPRKDE